MKAGRDASSHLDQPQPRLKGHQKPRPALLFALMNPSDFELGQGRSDLRPKHWWPISKCYVVAFTRRTAFGWTANQEPADGEQDTERQGVRCVVDAGRCSWGAMITGSRNIGEASESIRE